MCRVKQPEELSEMGDVQSSRESLFHTSWSMGAPAGKGDVNCKETGRGRFASKNSIKFLSGTCSCSCKSSSLDRDYLQHSGLRRISCCTSLRVRASPIPSSDMMAPNGVSSSSSVDRTEESSSNTTDMTLEKVNSPPGT